MNSEPCVRLAIRISPNMSEKPAASRNSRPPRARLLRVWMTTKYALPSCANTADSMRCSRRTRRPHRGPARAGSLQVACRRVVAGVHGILQEFLRIVGPELAHVRIGVHDGIDQPPLLALDPADIHVAHDVAI